MAVSKKAFVLGGVGVFLGLFIIGSFIDDDSASAPSNPALMQDASDVGDAPSSDVPALTPDGLESAMFAIKSYQQDSLVNTLEGYHQPDVVFSTQIPSERLVRWAPRGESSFDRDSRGCADIAANPIGAVRAAAAEYVRLNSTYSPPPKGDFEKSEDYQARISAEKQAFDAQHAGAGVSAETISLAMNAIFGNPKIIGRKKEDFFYDPDREVLKFVIGSSKSRPAVNGMPDFMPLFSFPVELSIPPEMAKKYFEGIPSSGYAGASQDGLLVAAVAIEMVGDKLVVREISITPNQWESGSIHARAMEASGVSFEHIQMNYALH